MVSISTTIVIITATIVMAVIAFLVIAYRDAQRCLHWHLKKHRSYPWVTSAPAPSALQRVLNTILFIKPI